MEAPPRGASGAGRSWCCPSPRDPVPVVRQQGRVGVSLIFLLEVCQFCFCVFIVHQRFQCERGCGFGCGYGTQAGEDSNAKNARQKVR